MDFLTNKNRFLVFGSKHAECAIGVSDSLEDFRGFTKLTLDFLFLSMLTLHTASEDREQRVWDLHRLATYRVGRVEEAWATLFIDPAGSS